MRPPPSGFPKPDQPQLHRGWTTSGLQISKKGRWVSPNNKKTVSNVVGLVRIAEVQRLLMRGGYITVRRWMLEFSGISALNVRRGSEPLAWPWFVLGFIIGFLKAHPQIETKIPTHGKPQLKIKDVFRIFMSPRDSFCPLLFADVA